MKGRLSKVNSSLEFILDQLMPVDDIYSRRMFGGYGIYAGEVFFGIYFRERLYFKTDESTRKKYAAKGMGPFRPSAKATLKNYYEVPVEVLEDSGNLRKWATKAIELAAQQAAGKRLRTNEARRSKK